LYITDPKKIYVRSLFTFKISKINKKASDRKQSFKHLKSENLLSNFWENNNIPFNLFWCVSKQK